MTRTVTFFAIETGAKKTVNFQFPCRKRGNAPINQKTTDIKGHSGASTMRLVEPPSKWALNWLILLVFSFLLLQARIEELVKTFQSTC